MGTLGTSAFPAYDHSDFQMGKVEELSKLHPDKLKVLKKYE